MKTIISETKDRHRLIIREANVDDAPDMVTYAESICRETDFLTFGPGEFGISVADEIRHLEQYATNEAELFILALIDDEIVGTLHFLAGKRPRMRHAGDFGMSVRQSFQRQGIGSMLIDTMINWADQGGVVRRIELRVRPDNIPAISLYRKKGFIEEGRHTGAICVDDIYHDLLSMAWIQKND